MNFSQTLEEIENSSAFANFKKKHEDAYLCAGFFVLDYQNEANQQQLDYCLKDETIFTIILNNEITIKKAETLEGREGKQEKLLELNKEIKIDLEEVEEIVKKKIQEQKINKKINKIIAVLQKHQGRQIWNLNCILSGMEILRVHADTDNGEILKFEKKSMFDFIKRVK